MLALAAFAVLAGAPDWIAPLVGTATAVAGILAAPELLFAADSALRPVQKLETRRFVNQARRKLEEIAPLTIGITGSFGKTTTKACVAEVAELRGPAYATPASYNTYLGVVRAINEGLTAKHRAFIAEMGAYRLGDVKELCELVRPRIGVLTAIGPAHLERFGSLDAIEQAKGELAEELPPDGVYVTNADDERCLRTAERTQARVILFSAAGAPSADVTAHDIEMAEGTTRFTLRHGLAGEVVVRSKLLGRHNVANLLAAAAVGPAWTSRSTRSAAPSRVSAARAPACADPEPPGRHRRDRRRLQLEPGRRRGGARGARLTRGRAQAARHAGHGRAGRARGRGERALRRTGGEVCDLVVLVGEERSKPILAGLSAASFPDSQVHVVANTSEAQALLAKTTRRGDVVLFENDLPDLYAEDVAAARAARGRRLSARELCFRANDAAGSSGRGPVRRPLGGARRLDHQRAAADGGHGAAARADPGLPRP